MYNLVIKDFRLLRKYGLLLLLYVVFFFFLIWQNPQTLSATGLYLSMMMLLFTTNSELRNKNGILIASLPVTRKDMVLSRYVGSLVYGVAGAACTLLIHAVLSLLPDSSVIAEIPSAGLALFSLVMSYFMCSVYLPLYYAFSEKGAQVVTLLTILIFSTTFPMTSLLTGLYSYDKMPEMMEKLLRFPGFLLPVAFSLLLLGASSLISLEVFKRKDIS